MGNIPIFCPKYCHKVANMPVTTINVTLVAYYHRCDIIVDISVTV